MVYIILVVSIVAFAYFVVQWIFPRKKRTTFMEWAATYFLRCHVCHQFPAEARSVNTGYWYCWECFRKLGREVI